MYYVQDYSFLYNNTFFYEALHFTHTWKTPTRLHDFTERGGLGP